MSPYLGRLVDEGNCQHQSLSEEEGYERDGGQEAGADDEQREPRVPQLEVSVERVSALGHGDLSLLEGGVLDPGVGGCQAEEAQGGDEGGPDHDGGDEPHEDDPDEGHSHPHPHPRQDHPLGGHQICPDLLSEASGIEDPDEVVDHLPNFLHGNVTIVVGDGIALSISNIPRCIINKTKTGKTSSNDRATLHGK